MNIFMTVVYFIAILVLVIVCHELGHFVAARLSKARVSEFSIGFPPRIVSRKWGDTKYTLGTIPLGAFVDIEEEEMNKKSWWVRLLIMAAGPAANIVLAFALLTTGFMIPQEATKQGGIMIAEVAPGSPAQEAGIMPGDRIVAIGGGKILSLDDLRKATQSNLDQRIEIVLDREEEIIVTSTIPRSHPPQGEGALGITIFDISLPEEGLPFPQALSESGRFILDFPRVLVDSLDEIAQNPGDALMGPIGAGQVTGEVMEEYGGASPLLRLAALISIGIGIFNLLPLPPLDGGGIILALIEGVRRGKKVSPALQKLIYSLGWAFILTLFVFITYNDIARLISGEGILP